MIKLFYYRFLILVTDTCRTKHGFEKQNVLSSLNDVVSTTVSTVALRRSPQDKYWLSTVISIVKLKTKCQDELLKSNNRLVCANWL